MKKGTAQARFDLTVQYLKDMAMLYVRDQPGKEVHNGTLLMYLRTLTREDALISHAVTRLLSTNQLELGSDRVVRLGGKR